MATRPWTIPVGPIKIPQLGKPVAPRRRRRGCTRGLKSCCKQLADALKDIPGFDKTKLHKPKVPIAARVSCLCDWLPAKDAVTPILFHTLRRFLSGLAPGNEIEEKLFSFLHTLRKTSPGGMSELERAQKNFLQMAKAEHECLFDSQFLDLPLDKPVDFVASAETLFNEFMIFGQPRILYDELPPVLPAGKARPFPAQAGGLIPGAGVEFVEYTLPFPVICAVNGIHTPQFAVVGPGSYEPWEFEQRCAPIITKTGDVDPNCQTMVLADGCAGGIYYAPLGSEFPAHSPCLKVPSTRPGLEVELVGFNFFSTKCKVKLTNADNPNETYLLDATVYGDGQTPLQEQNGANPSQVIADCRVKDRLIFSIPQDAPHGKYRIDVIVPNDGSSLDGQVYTINDYTPPELATYLFNHRMTLISIKPRPDVNYRIWLEKGRCYDQTDWEWGSDEIWVTPIILRQPFDATGNPLEPQLTKLDPLTWGDVDQGETKSYWTNLFGADAAGESVGPGSLGIGLIGLEVDDEDAAKKQIWDYWGAVGQFYVEFWKEIGGLGAAAGVAATAASSLGWGALAVGVAVVVTSLIYGAWAPPDLIALDFISLDEEILFELTNATAPTPPSKSSWLNNIKITTTCELKWPNAYTELRRYAASEEGSDYGFWLRYERVT